MRSAASHSRSVANELLFVAETNPGPPPEPPPQTDPAAGPHQPPPFTVKLLMWSLPQAGRRPPARPAPPPRPHPSPPRRLPRPSQTTEPDQMASRVRRDASELSVARSVMYSDAGFDVSSCGRYLALCELDPQVPPPPPPRPDHAAPPTRAAPARPPPSAHPAAAAAAPQEGYHLRVFSLQPTSRGQQLQTVALPNCPFVTSVQFSPLTTSVLIGYGRCQAPPGVPPAQQPQYAVLRCIQFRPQFRSSGSGSPQTVTQTLQAAEVEIVSVDSTDESNVALFHPHPAAAALLGFMYATKDGRIRAFRFDRLT